MAEIIIIILRQIIAQDVEVFTIKSMQIDNLNATTDEAYIYFENKLSSELAPLTESAKTS